MEDYNNCDCKDGKCPSGIEKVRKISLTPREKRKIFHSILNLASGRSSEIAEKGKVVSELVEM
jgi:hypothetical protein